MRFLQVIYFVVILSSCAALSSILGSTPAIVQTIDTIADIVAEMTGKDLDDIPHTCETEWTQDKHLLLLCDFDLND